MRRPDSKVRAFSTGSLIFYVLLTLYALSMIGNLIKIELAYINTSHPDFIGGR